MDNIKKIKHKSRKYFGEPNEKWARGGGPWGYGGRYGHNKHGSAIDYRSRTEKRNADDRRVEESEEKA